MRVLSVQFSPVPVVLRIRCRATPEQQRMMYLAGRQAREDALAKEWREQQAARRVPAWAVEEMHEMLGWLAAGIRSGMASVSK